ncbi:hypothetical protein, partial [Escherichia coli]|uniref:hypothetical protein n=1 Tax=Escherichia coli TaxID=562 RepID=UPI0023AEEF15
MKLSQFLAIYAKNNRLLRFTSPSPNISIANISARKIHSLFFREPRQPGGCKLKTAPVRPVVAARPAE